MCFFDEEASVGMNLEPLNSDYHNDACTYNTDTAVYPTECLSNSTALWAALIF